MKQRKQRTMMHVKRERGNSRTDRLLEYVKTIAIILVLLVVTLVALEIPREFYDHSDEQLMNQVIENTYSVSVVREPMNLSQKIEALQDDDCIVAEKKDVPDAAETEQWTKRMCDEINIMLDYGWQDALVHILENDETVMILRYVEIIKVEDDKIYSYDLGVLTFYNGYTYGMLGPGMILFDEETDKILYMEAMLDYYIGDIGYADAIYGSSQYEVIMEADSYEIYDGEISAAITDAELLEETGKVNVSPVCFYDALTDYYEQTVDQDDFPYISENAICVCPFSIDSISGKTMTAIYDFSYDYYSEMYY